MFFLYILIFAMPFYRHKIFNAGVGSFTVIKAIGLLGLLAALAYGAKHGFPQYLKSRQSKLFVALCALAFLSFLRSPRGVQINGFDPILHYVTLISFFIILLTLVDNSAKLRYAFLSSFAGMAFASLYVIAEWVKYHGNFANFRPGWVVGDPNYFSLSAMLAIPIGYYWLLAERQRLWKCCVFGTLAMTSLAVALCASRGWVLSFAAFLLYVLFRSRHPWRNATVIVLIMAIPMLVIPRSPMERLFDPQVADVNATELRLTIWKFGFMMFRNHPLVGVGIGQFKPKTATYLDKPRFARIAHNTYLELAAEMGVFALLIWCWLLWETYKSIAQTRQTAHRIRSPLLYGVATGMQGGLWAFFAGSAFLSAEYVKFLWFYVFTSIVMAEIARREGLRQEAQLKQEEEPAPVLEPVAMANAEAMPAVWLRP